MVPDSAMPGGLWWLQEEPIIVYLGRIWNLSSHPIEDGVKNQSSGTIIIKKEAYKFES